MFTVRKLNIFHCISDPCKRDEDYCHNNGLCITNSMGQPFCICENGYSTQDQCETKSNNFLIYYNFMPFSNRYYPEDLNTWKSAGASSQTKIYFFI